MAIEVVLEDHNGNISHQAKISQEAKVAQLIPAIISAVKLPITDNAGRPITYHLSHHGRRLQENETLASAEVQEGDTLTIVPEMTAGCFPLGTLIRMADGKQIPIESIKIDDEVMSWDLERQKPTSTLITGIHKEQAASTLLLINGQLKLSISQPVWVNNSWEFAEDIRIGDQFAGLQRQAIASNSTDSVDKLFNDQQQEVTNYNINSLETIDGLFDVRHLSTLDGLPFFAEDILVQSYNATGLTEESQPPVSKGTFKSFRPPFTDSLLLDRFTTLEKGAEISSEQLKRVEKTLEGLQISLRKIQMTIGEALISPGVERANKVVEIIGPQLSSQQETLSQIDKVSKQYSYPALPTSLEEELRNILATSRKKEIGPEAVTASSTFHIHIVDEPLTVQNLSAIFTSLNTLSLKCQLIAQGRFDNLVEYTQTHTDRFGLGANFFIADITHNSPFNFDMSLNPESAAKALQLAIDAVSLAGLRKKEQELVLQTRELDIKVKEREAQVKADHDETSHQRELQEIELERQKRLLELEKQQFELEKQRFELGTMRIKFALETAERMVDLLHPGTEGATKAMIVQTLLPDLLQLGASRGLQLVLPPSQEKPEP